LNHSETLRIEPSERRQNYVLLYNLQCLRGGGSRFPKVTFPLICCCKSWQQEYSSSVSAVKKTQWQQWLLRCRVRKTILVFLLLTWRCTHSSSWRCRM